MTQRRHIWRQWMAALCVVLMAALFMQEAEATQHAVAEARDHLELSLGEGVFVHVHADDVQHESDAPPHDGAAPHAHQCLCVQMANLPAVEGVGLIHGGGVNVEYLGATTAHLVHRLYGLERPPRSSARV